LFTCSACTNISRKLTDLTFMQSPYCPCFQ
jgi:hypothetical protein